MKAIAAVALTTALLIPMAPARAAEAEPAVASSAWYWEDQMSQPITDPTSGADLAVIELPNPWCPSTPVSTPEETCNDGRLPIEVRNGDYETPNKVSAVGFDLALIPLGSDISKFTVTFREAPSENEIPSMNHTDKELQACVITDFFGDGYARQYTEIPKFTCSETDPRAKRADLDGGGEEGAPFGWTFDLTEIAQAWMEEGAVVTAVLLVPGVPEGKDDPAAADPGDNWRVVLAGPLAEDGVITHLVYKAPPVPTIGGTGSTGNTTDTFGGSTGSDFGTSGGFDTSSTGDTGGLDTAAGDTAGGPTPAPAGTPLASAPTGGEDQGPGLPGYFWLALIGGLIGASLLKSAVLEQTTGSRPGGVLSQIREINTLRRGSPALATAGAGAPARAPAAGLRGAAARLKIFKRR